MPATECLQPSLVSFSIICGRTLSEEDVPITIHSVHTSISTPSFTTSLNGARHTGQLRNQSAVTGTSIARVFFITAGTFGAMSLYGYTTKRDLSKFGSFLINHPQF